MKNGHLDNRSAITLIEVIGAILLVSLIFAVGTVTVMTGLRLFKSQLSRSVISDDIIVAMEWIKKDALRADNVDITISNEITLDMEDFGVSPPVASQIRYYVKGGTTELYRQVVGSGIDGKLITDMIDTAQLPVFSQPAGDNYLLSEIWIKYPGTVVIVHQDMGVMLRCRRTAS